MLVLVSMKLAGSVELVFHRAGCSGVVAWLPGPPLALLVVRRAVPAISSWWSVVVAAPAISVVWEAGRDHLDSSVVVEVASRSFSSSIETSVTAVVVVVAIVSSGRDICFVTYGVFSVSPAVGVLQ